MKDRISGGVLIPFFLTPLPGNALQREREIVNSMSACPLVHEYRHSPLVQKLLFLTTVTHYRLLSPLKVQSGVTRECGAG